MVVFGHPHYYPPERNEGSTSPLEIWPHREREPFAYPDFSAATTVGGAFVYEGSLVETEAETFVPDERWDRDVATRDG